MWRNVDGVIQQEHVPAEDYPVTAAIVGALAQLTPAEVSDLDDRLSTLFYVVLDEAIESPLSIDDEKAFVERELPDAVLDIDWSALATPDDYLDFVRSVDLRWRLDVIAFLQQLVNGDDLLVGPLRRWLWSTNLWPSRRDVKSCGVVVAVLAGIWFVLDYTGPRLPVWIYLAALVSWVFQRWAHTLTPGQRARTPAQHDDD